MKKLTIFIIAFIPMSIFAQNALPVISNVQIELTVDDQLILNYDLEDAENDACEITFRAAEKGALTLDFETSNATGDVGPGIMPGVGKTVTWDYSSLGVSDTDFRLMLVADDGQSVDIQSIVDAVEATELSGNLTFLEGIRHRSTGAAHLEETQDFLRFQFLGKGLELNEQTWDFGSYTARNIIGRKIGTSEEAVTYILDGHYDSVSDAPGADDNASAVAGMIEALRVLAPYSFKKSIRFIGFDLEEEFPGLLGSKKYVNEGIPTGETIGGVLNFEMIGFYSDEPNSQEVPMGFGLLFPDAVVQIEGNENRGDFITVVSDQNSIPLEQAYVNAANTYVPDLKTISLVNGAIIPPDLLRSDHAAFWGGDIPALMITDGAEYRNEFYHTPEDTSDKLNFTFMRQVTQAAVATLAELAEIQHATTWWTDTDFFVSSVGDIGLCEFKISPNPVSTLLRVEWPACQPGDFELELIDLTGRVVRRHRHFASQNFEKQIVDVRGLEAGIYFLRVQNENGQWAERVIVE